MDTKGKYGQFYVAISSTCEFILPFTGSWTKLKFVPELVFSLILDLTLSFEATK